MGAYVIRRLLLFVPMLVAISVIAFILIQLPPGDYLTSEIMAMAERGEEVHGRRRSRRWSCATA